MLALGEVVRKQLGNDNTECTRSRTHVIVDAASIASGKKANCVTNSCEDWTLVRARRPEMNVLECFEELSMMGDL